MENSLSSTNQILEEMGLSTEFLIFESISTIMTILALIIIIIASIKIFLTKKIPGNKYILLGLIGNIIAVIISSIYEEENYIVSGVFEITSAAFFMFSAYGYFKLAKYLSVKNANKTQEPI